MAADPKTTLDRAVTDQTRRLHRDAHVPLAPLDKASVLAHLRAQLAQLEESTEVTHGDA